MAQAIAENEVRFWDYLLQLEHALMFATRWWDEATRGHRVWIIPHETIQWLLERLAYVPVEARHGTCLLYTSDAADD